MRLLPLVALVALLPPAEVNAEAPKPAAGLWDVKALKAADVKPEWG